MRAGRLIATGAVCSLIGFPNTAHCAAAKHGVAGLVKSLVRQGGPHGITAD